MADPTLPEIRPIEGFENYGVSADGRVWRLTPGARGRSQHLPIPWPLAEHVNDCGYRITWLYRERKRHSVSVAHLVLKAFVGPRPAGLVAAHNNGARADNRPSNLRWATMADNNRDKKLHGTQPRGEDVASSKLTEQQVVEIKRAICSRRPGESVRALARRYGVSHTMALEIRKGKWWRHVDAREPVAAWDQE